MSKADELIAGLQSTAELDSEGGFSLDREKAREKMRQFQLADPHRYVLLLVEAAVLRGATRIEFEIDTDDMHMRFDAALDWADLDELYTSLFVDRTSLAIRARRELALACNAAMALNPRWIRIESYAREGEAITGVRALLRPDQADEIERVEQPPAELGDKAPCTAIHVKERFRPGLLVRFLHTLGEALRETELLRSRCALATTQIWLNGDRISHGLPSSLIAELGFAAEHMRGVAGIHEHELDRSALVLLSNGVEIMTVELSESVPGLWFWIDGSELRKDVSQAAIVRSDPAYEAALRAIAGARNQVLARLVELWAAGEFNEHPTLPAAKVFELLRRCFLRWADHDWLHADAGPLGKLADLPLWRTVDRRWLSPRALLSDADPDRGIMVTHRDFEGVVPLGWGPVIHAYDGALELAAINRVYPNAADVTEDLQREVPWELNRRRWRARPHAPALPRGAGVSPIDLQVDEYRGQVVARPRRSSDVRLIVDGCLLCEAEFNLGPLGISAALEGPFRPAPDYERVIADRALARGALLLLAQLPALLTELAERGEPRELLRASLLALAQPGFAIRWLEVFGIDGADTAMLLTMLGTPQLLPEFGLSGEPTAIARQLQFSTADGREVSLVEIEHDRRARTREPGKILFVDRSVPQAHALDELILRVSVDERLLLRAIFGRDRLHNDTGPYLEALGRRNFLARPTRAPTLVNATWEARVGEREGAAVSGLVGVNLVELREWDGSSARKAKVTVLVDDRELTTIELRAWVPGVSASLKWDAAPINATWDGLASTRTTDLRPLIDAVDAGVVAILEDLAIEAHTRGQRPDPMVRRLLWIAMASPFISTEHAAAWRRIRAEQPFAAAAAAYFELLTLFPSIALLELRESITLLLDDGRALTRAAVLELLDRSGPGPAADREFQRAILDRYELFEQVPLLEATTGAPVSLAQLERHFAVADEVAYVRDMSLQFDGGDEYLIVRLDPTDHVGLLRLFRREALHEVSAWIHERRHQQRFETQAPLAAIRVQDHNRLVGVKFAHEGVTGELAIPPWVPGDGGVMKLTVCHQRRVVQEVELHAKLPILAILDDPDAPVSADFRTVDLASSRMARLRKLLDELLDDKLLPALADAYPGFDARQRSIAREWIASHWRRASPRAGSYPSRLGAAGRRFAELPLFVDTDQSPRSLAELSARYREHKRLWYVESDPGYAVAPPFPIVWARPHELGLLRDLFDDCQDFRPRWEARVDGERRRARAPTLPSITAPADALVTAKINRHELQGILWLPGRVPFESGVTLGAEGKVLRVMDFIHMLPTQGIVDGVTADDGFEQPELSNPQARLLDARAIFLYSELLNHHRKDLEHPERPDFHAPAVAQVRAIRLELLRRAAIALAEARRRGVGFDAILGGFARRLDDEPLLELASGRLISVDVARKAQPFELRHLDLWDPDGPALDPAERARLLLGDDAEPPPVEELSVAADQDEDLDGIEVLEEIDAVEQPATAEQPSEPILVPPALDLERIAAEVEVAAAATPEPEPEPPPPPPRDYVGECLERIREELRLLRERHEIVLQEGHLDAISADVRNGKILVRIEDRRGVIFDSTHPRFVRAMEDPDPIWISFLASVAYTAINRWLEEVTDADELVFHHRHSGHLLSGLLGADEARG